MGKKRLQTDLELVPDPRLALTQEAAFETEHIKKRKRRNKGKTVSLDVEELKNFVSGFRKRRLDRRAHAKKKIAEMEKTAKRIKKKEREQQLKVQLGMGKNEKWISSSDSDNDAKEETVYTKVYETSDLKTTVKVEPLKLSTFDNDDDDEEDELN